MNHSIDLDHTGTLKPLIKAYVNESEDLGPFIYQFPDLESLKKRINHLKPQCDRKVLHQVIEAQNQKIITSKKTRLNFDLILNKSTFTVTTGHQPCLFTGPLYVIIKILQTIKLAEVLKQAFPKFNFVPVYWMGAEDHDFDEVNHFNAFNQTLSWETLQKGPVGRFDVQGLEDVYEEFAGVISAGEYRAQLLEWFGKAYACKTNYSQATRKLVNALFGDRGLLILDGDDAILKRSIIPLIKRELDEQVVYKRVTSSLSAMTPWGKPQVMPRELNLFYVEKGLRSRMIKTDSGFKTVDGDKQWSEKAMHQMVDLNPERLSPNVLLRPLFQEMVLPNLAYIGGTGEIAYWLQLGGLFQSFGLDLPFLVVRNSFLFLNEKSIKKINKLGLVWSDLFLSDVDLTKKIVNLNNGHFSLDDEHQAIEQAMDRLNEKAVEIDPTLKQVVAGEKQKMIKALYALEKRTFRAQKRINSEKIQQALALKQRVFPNGSLQERYLNFSEFFVHEGPAFFDRIYEAIDPLSPKMNAIRF